MGAEVLNSTFALLLCFCGLLNICASNPPTASSPKPCVSWTTYSDRL